MSSSYKTYAITGASRGLGLEFVKQLAAKGNTIVAFARNPTESSGLSQLVDNKNVFAVKMDISDEESIKAAASSISKIVPDGIDVLINNAGINGDVKLNSLTIPRKEYIKLFETNTIAASDVIQALLPLLRQRGQDKTKRIVNISSTLGSLSLVSTLKFVGNVSPAYCASKAALNMITKIFADDLEEENFIVNSMCPGWVQTDMGGKEAPVKLEDSISGMLNTIENVATKENNGLFLNFQGQIVAF